MSKHASRRKFLKTAAVAGAVAIVGSLLARTPPVISHEGNHPRRKWVMVIDLEKCDGCKQCVDACIEEHLVPPAWGEPNHNGRQEWIKVYDRGEDLGPTGRDGNFMPFPCMQCENAPCVNVCPVGATYHDSEGVVLIDHDKCIGCRYCMVACPYERRYFNWGEPHTEEERARLAFANYSPQYPVPHRRGTVEKCMFCSHRSAMGRLPACVEACNKAGMKALYFGDANEDAVSNGSEILKFSDLLKSRGSFRVREELGTEPKVFYLPPRGRS